MKKRISYTLLIFLIALMFMPLIEGTLFKNSYLHLIEIINQDKRANIQLISYEQGWLHSHAKIVVTLNKGLMTLYQIGLSKTNGPVSFTIEEEIAHGPIIYDRISNMIELGHAKIQNDILLPAEIKTNYFSTLSSQGIVRVDLISKFNGNWRGQLKFPTFVLSFPDIGELTWQGLAGEFNIVLADHYFKYTDFEAELGSFSFKGSPTNSYVKSVDTYPLSYQYNASYDNFGLYSGYTNMYTHSISVIKSVETRLIGERVAIHTAFSMDNKTFYSGTLSINIKRINASSFNIPYIQPFHVLITVSNFSIKGLLSYLDNLQLNSPEAIQKDVHAGEGFLMHMILPESNMQGDIALNSTLGSLTCHFNLLLRPDVPPPSTFKDLIASISTTANFIISPSVMTKLIELYNNKISVTKTPQGTTAQIMTQPKTPTPPATTPPSIKNNITPIPNPANNQATETPQQLVDDLLYGGFLNKDDNNNYITELTIKSGVWKLNDRVVSY